MRLGLSAQRGSGSRPPENTIKAALKKRHHIRASRDGTSLLIQPYALLNAEGSRTLHGVVVAIDGEARGEWLPGNIEVSTLSNIEVYDETFVSSDAFDPSPLNGAKAVVEGFDPFEDAGEETPGKG